MVAIRSIFVGLAIAAFFAAIPLGSVRAQLLLGTGGDSRFIWLPALFLMFTLGLGLAYSCLLHAAVGAMSRLYASYAGSVVSTPRCVTE